MANPLSGGGMNGNQLPPNMVNGINGVRQMMGMMRTVANPTAMLQQNPQFAQVMQMCKGKNPQDVFMQMCKTRGIDPNMVLNELQK